MDPRSENCDRIFGRQIGAEIRQKILTDRSKFFDLQAAKKLGTKNICRKERDNLIALTRDTQAGLPEFSWSKHTKTGKMYQTTTNYTKRL
jgi:hypothetical protein